MEFFVGREVITPEESVMQAGFSSRRQQSVGIHDDLTVSAVILGSERPIVLLALDVTYGDRSFAASIEQKLAERYQLAPEQILINYSHSHSSVALTGTDPSLRRQFPFSISQTQPRWDTARDTMDYSADLRLYQKIEACVCRLLDRGLNSLTSGCVQFCRGRTDFGVSRRYPSSDGILWRPCFDENRRDSTLDLIRLLDDQGSLRALIFSLGCHPTALGPDNLLLSADYPGIVRSQLEQNRPELTTVFLQGCGADVKPRVSAAGERFRSCTFSELEEGSASLTAEIEALLLAGAWRDLEGPVTTRRSEVFLRTENWPAARWQQMLEKPDLPEYRRISIERTIADIQAGQERSRLPNQMTCVDLGGLKILGMEHEMVSEYGRRIKTFSSQPVITLGYCRSSGCYIPTRLIQQEGGYENESYISARLAGPFFPETEEILYGQAIKLMSPEALA